MTGERVRAKEATRQRISDVATELFLHRGFETVTVAEVAAAAGVSKVTVFAHFPRKEDLLIDRFPEMADLVISAIRDRGAEESPIAALRALALWLATQRHPLSGLGRGVRPFYDLFIASPSLMDRARELVGDLERVMAEALAGPPRPVAEPRLIAALVVAAYRTEASVTTQQIVAGRRVAAVITDHRRRVNRAFDAVQAALDVLST